MRRIQALLLPILALAAFTPTAQAHDPIAGAIIGTGIGAAIGGPPGAAVGAIIGVIAGSEHHQHHHRRARDWAPRVAYDVPLPTYAPEYAWRPVYYDVPAPARYAPQPVYYEPAPAYYAPAAVYARAAPRYYYDSVPRVTHRQTPRYYDHAPRQHRHERYRHADGYHR
jgi:hypothetical protein